MSFQHPSYLLFLPLVAVVYLKLPRRGQTPFLLAASALFYGLNLKTGYESSVSAGVPVGHALFRCGLSLAVVVGLAVFVWRLALAIAARPREKRGRLLTVGVTVLLVLLAVFKYYGFSPLPTLFADTVLEKLPFPLGISFFTFAAISYLVDVTRGGCQAETSLVHTATYLYFFGTVTSGPICRAGQLLPQLHAEHRFDAQRTVNALRLFAVGLFQKVAVSDVMGMVVNQVFGAELAAYGAPMLLLALVLYTFQLYFDFSGYSNMARASGMLLGIDLPENFKTPFFATNFSGFWSRWHISLSSWLQDYLFMTLAWADVSKTPLIGRSLAKKWMQFPVTFCIFVTFVFSGIWHGNTLLFLIWGLLQAAYRIGEELLHRRLGKPKKKGVPARVLWGKRAVVFILWNFSMLFFRIGSGPNTGSLGECGVFLAGLFRGWSPVRFAGELWGAIATGFYAKPVMQIAWLAFVALGLTVGFWLDWQQFTHHKGRPVETVLAAQKPALRWALYYLLVICILAGLILQNGGFGGGQSFAYANF